MESSTNEIPVISYRTSITIESDADQAVDDHLGGRTDNVAETGESDAAEQIACCWLDKRLTAGDLLFSVPLMLIGLTVVAWGFTNPSGRPDEAIPEIIACSGFGGVSFLIGLAIILLRICVQSEGIEVTAEGIAVITKRKQREYRWSEINKVMITEFTENRLSDTEVTCGVEPVKGKNFGFQSSYLGDPHTVLQCVLTNCDYIVRNPEGYSRNNK